MDQDNQSDEYDKKDIDVPFFEFETILDATDNFKRHISLDKGDLALFTRWFLCTILEYYVSSNLECIVMHP